jgi:hypothetical protein
MNRHWRPAKPACTVKKEFRRVGTDTIVFAVWLLGGGLIISAIILMTEIMLRNRYAQIPEQM